VALGLIVFAIKPWLGAMFLLAYAVYFWREMRSGGEGADGEDLEPLKLQPKRAVPTTAAVAVQTVVTLALIFGASQLFVAQLEWAGPALGLPAVVVALLLSPVATELPEIMNAVIWVRQGKTQLALANISGAMMIQATVPSALGIFYTAWRFDAPLIAAGAATLAAVVYLLGCSAPVGSPRPGCWARPASTPPSPSPWSRSSVNRAGRHHVAGVRGAAGQNGAR
jgi:cation:H+ antiporter